MGQHTCLLAASITRMIVILIVVLLLVVLLLQQLALLLLGNSRLDLLLSLFESLLSPPQSFLLRSNWQIRLAENLRWIIIFECCGVFALPSTLHRYRYLGCLPLAFAPPRTRYCCRHRCPVLDRTLSLSKVQRVVTDLLGVLVCCYKENFFVQF